MTQLADHLNHDPAAVAARITALGGYARKKPATNGRRSWLIQCPHPDHPDTNPSATLSEARDGGTLMYCFGGACGQIPRDAWFKQSISRLNAGTAFTPAKPRNTRHVQGGGTLTATYRYYDGEGRAFEKLRYDVAPGVKRFEWRTITGVTYITGLLGTAMQDLNPYGSEDLAGQPGRAVFWVEGEKDADRLREHGYLAVSSPAGATGPLPRLDTLTGRTVIVIADRDPAGLHHAREALDALKPIAARLALYGPKPRLMKSDISDHFDAGYGIDDLEQVIALHDTGTAPASTDPASTVDEYASQTLPEPEPVTNGLLPDTWWTQHPTLQAIRDTATHRMLRPEPVLAAALVTAATCTSPNYLLPPIAGAPGSLNIFTLLYGASGMGKSTSLALARELLGIPNERWDPEEWQLGAKSIDHRGLHTVKLGSGEGIAHAYAERITAIDNTGPKPKTTTKLARVRDHVLIADAEGSALAAHQGRAGATIGPVLLSAFSGEALLSTYSKRGADNIVDFDLSPLTYRLGIIIGIQPDIAGHYLDQAGVGWPQRLLWATVHGPIAETAPQAAAPAVRWQRPPDPPQPVHIDVDPAIAQQLRQQIHEYRNTGGNPLDSHAGLLQLKTAAAVHALLNPGQPVAITLEDWALAAAITQASNQVRDTATRHVTDKAKTAARARIDAKITETLAATRASEHDNVKRVARGLARIIRRHAAEQPDGHECSGSACLRRGTASRDRAWLDDAIEYAVETGQITQTVTSDGMRYRTPETP